MFSANHASSNSAQITNELWETGVVSVVSLVGLCAMETVLYQSRCELWQQICKHKLYHTLHDTAPLAQTFNLNDLTQQTGLP